MERRSRAWLGVWVRLAGIVLAAGVATGCITPTLLERARGTTEVEEKPTRISAVKRAELMETGELILCLELRDFTRRRVTLEVPLQTIPKTLRKRAPLDLGRKPGFDGPSDKDPNTLRFVFLQEELVEGCDDEDDAEELAIYEVPRTLQLQRPGVYTSQTGDGMILRYRSEQPLWSNSRNLEFSPVLETASRQVKVSGNRLYYLGLPGAIVADVFLTLLTLGL